MIDAKTDKRKLQGAQTKQKLYDIAERLFCERDFSSVNIEEITQQAGITKGAFYVHFESKDALIAEIISDYAARTDTGYQSFLHALPKGISASETILAFGDKICDTLTNVIGRDNMAKVYQMMLQGTVDTESVKGYGREIYTLFYEILARGIQLGEFRQDLSAEQLSSHFVMAVRGISYEWCVRYPNFDFRAQMNAHCRLLIRGILA